MYTHFQILFQLVYALPSSFMFIYIYRHIYMSICFDYSAMTPYILYTPIIIRLCVPAHRGWARCWHNLTPCSRVCVSIFIHVYASYEYTHTIIISKMFNSVCTYPSLMCVLQPCLYLYLLHPPENELTCECLHQDCSIHITRIHVHKWMQIYIYIFMPTYIYIYNEHKPIQMIKFT